MQKAGSNGDVESGSAHEAPMPVESGERNGESGTPASSANTEMEQSQELAPPPLPPRPGLTERPQTSSAGSFRLSKRSSRPQLQSYATTAVSLADVQTQSHLDPASLQSSPASRAVSRKQSFTRLGRFASNANSDADDSASLKSYGPTLDAQLDGDIVIGALATAEASPAWRSLSSQVHTGNEVEPVLVEDDLLDAQMQHEFKDIDSIDEEGSNAEALLSVWKAKLKHFFILSASGKPVYSRHGDDQLTSHYIGVVQTLISFYQGADDPLRCFTAGDTRFVMLSKGPLNLVAISRLNESDSQLRNQLEALYMQVLSTLTLPNMERMFSNRPSTDLRRALQGTDGLLDGLADEFTRGSPSSLLSALECLRLRKTDRNIVNDTFLKVRSANLLYGLIVAAGRLVSVVRPKKHSLHPGDLHLIFNMLFEAGSVRAGGGENWIPLCLPGFNNTGYLYMYVSFFSTSQVGVEPPIERPSSAGAKDELAVVLISANKESFFELRRMRNDLVAQLSKNGSMAAINTSIRKGRSSCSEIVPGTVLRHFLYKSRGNVQFTMPSFEPDFHGLAVRRKLMSLYQTLHESIHSRTAHLRVQHCVSRESTALAWETPMFELYCVAGPSASRAALAQGANRLVQWIRREEERVFIIGGAVF
jgi:vacuolar fusion protein MON1